MNPLIASLLARPDVAAALARCREPQPQVQLAQAENELYKLLRRRAGARPIGGKRYVLATVFNTGVGNITYRDLLKDAPQRLWAAVEAGLSLNGASVVWTATKRYMAAGRPEPEALTMALAEAAARQSRHQPSRTGPLPRRARSVTRALTPAHVGNAKSAKSSGTYQAIWTEIREGLGQLLAARLPPEITAHERARIMEKFARGVEALIMECAQGTSDLRKRYVKENGTVVPVPYIEIRNACHVLGFDPPLRGKRIDMVAALKRKRTLAAKYHPDFSGDPATAVYLNEVLKAYETLEIAHEQGL